MWLIKTSGCDTATLELAEQTCHRSFISINIDQAAISSGMHVIMQSEKHISNVPRIWCCMRLSDLIRANEVDFEGHIATKSLLDDLYYVDKLHSISIGCDS